MRAQWILLAVSAAVSLAAAELVLARFAPQVQRVPRIWHFDAALGWAHRPGARGLLIDREIRVEMAINEQGLRGPAVTPDPPVGTRRVALFGDSFTEGWGVAEPDTLRARLEERLRAREPRVEVLNFGVAGYGTDQALLAHQQRGARFAPEVVALLFFSNDLWDNTNPRGIGGRGQLVPKPRFQLTATGALVLGGVPVPRAPGWDPPRVGSAAWWKGLGPALAEHSQVAVLLRRAAGSWTRLPEAPAYYQRLYGPADVPEQRNAWALAGALVAAFARVAEANGAHFVLVYVPAIVEVEPDTWRRTVLHSGLAGDLDLEQPSRLLGRAAAAAGVAYLDLLPAFRADASGRSLFLHEGHWNGAGHALAARELDAFLVARGWAR